MLLPAQKIRREFWPPLTVSRFMNSPSFRRGIRGPRGSGKSTGCIMELGRRGREQRKSPMDGYRYTRFAVIRNTYRELEDTTLKSWKYWYPEEHYGVFNYRTMTHNINVNDMRMEVIFRSLDRPGDVKKTLSLELTGAYLNEAREIGFGLVSALDDCIGRYPPEDHGFPTWQGLIMDTNAPAKGHWWYDLSEVNRQDPAHWEFFTQPGGLLELAGKFRRNPKAENLEILEQITPNYYEVKAAGKKKDHIRVYYCNQYGFVVDGKPVHEEYADAIHCSKEIIRPVHGRTIAVGLDFGLTPAAAFGQRLANGCWIGIDELVATRMGIKNFAKELNILINGDYKGFQFEFYGDPSGDDGSDVDDTTPFQILQANGINAVKAWHNNDPQIRREAMKAPLSRIIDGKPGFLLSPKCPMWREALMGGFHLKEKQIAGPDVQYHLKPNKNIYSHIGEAGEYMMLGAGEGMAVITTPTPDIDKSRWGLKGGQSSPHGWMH